MEVSIGGGRVISIMMYLKKMLLGHLDVIVEGRLACGVEKLNVFYAAQMMGLVKWPVLVDKEGIIVVERLWWVLLVIDLVEILSHYFYLIYLALSW